VVVELGAVISVSPGIIHTSTSTRWTFFSALEGHIGLGTDDRFDALVVAGFIEVEYSVHVSVVGDA
jgi:hypothetical protein